MSYLIKCCTLFDITHTGVMNRNRSVNNDIDWVKKRNSQSNLDTILQIISLRSQPDMVNLPCMQHIDLTQDTKFGYAYKSLGTVRCWTFNFSVHHKSVFNNGISELGALYMDCQNVPMMKCGTEAEVLSNTLDVSEALKNIFFEASYNG